MGPRVNYGPIITKFHSVISSPKKLSRTKFCYDSVIFYGFRRTKMFSGSRVYIRSRVNYEPIFTKFGSVISVPTEFSYDSIIYYGFRRT